MHAITWTHNVSFSIGLATALLAATWTSSASAVAYNWINPAGGLWTDASWDNAGDPDDISDTATFGDLSGPYTVTLGVPRSIGGLNFAAASTDPTLTVNSTLNLLGTSNIGGGTINGTGTIAFNHNSITNWTSGTPGGMLTFLVPHEHTVTVNNTPGTFAIGTDQKLHIAATGGVGGFVGDLTDRTTTFSNGFNNEGIIQLGNVAPGDNYGVLRLIVTNGAVTNNAAGNINFLPRSATSSGAPWNTREIRSSIVNSGTITSYATDGILGGTGKTVTNSGTINTDHSIFTSSSSTPGITITGTSFTNTGALNIGANDGGLGGGRISLHSTTVDLNAGTIITGPGELGLSGGTVNIANSASITGLNRLTLGRNTITTTINSGTADLSDTSTYYVPGGSNVTWNRANDWTISNSQTLWFDGPPVGGDNASHLNLAVNVNNSGLIRMGRQPGNNHVQANLTLTGATTFTNNADGVIDMVVRGPTSDDPTWNSRFINAEVVNNGTINAYASNGRLGAAGKTVSNAGTINIDSSQFAAPRKAVLQMFGDSFTNVAGGNIDLQNGVLWLNTPTVNYDGGTITGTTGATIRLGSASIDTNFIFNGGAEITDPITWHIPALAEATVTRSTTWNIAAGSGVFFDAPADPGFTGLTSTQDVSNSGLVQMGRPAPGDNFANQYFRVNSTNSVFTNNADGVITMYPRSGTNTGDPHSIRRLEAELINNGQLTTFTHRAIVGKSLAGIDHVNNGTITVNNSMLTGTPRPQIDFLGDSLLNAANGVINGNGIINVATLNGAADVLQNAGTISPGLSAGLLTVQGNLNFQSGGQLYIEVVGEDAVSGVDYDQLTVTGNVTGLTTADLVVNIDSVDFDLEGDVLTILTGSATNFAGQSFNSVTFTGGGMFKADVIYGNGFIQLTNIESFVPEPSSGCLLMLGLVGLRRRRRKATA